MIFPILHLSNNLKEKKRNINIDLAVLPSYNIGGKIEEVSVFINAARLYLRMKMTDEVATT